MEEMSMRERIARIIKRGRDKDHSPEAIADAVLEALYEPDEGMLRAANDWFPGDGPDFIEQWQKAIDHARNDGR